MVESVSAQKQKDQFLAARISIIGSTIMFLISAVVALITDSITLILDASASIVILVVGLLISFSVKKIHLPPDESYNFGYHKYEPLTAAVQNVLIVAVCIVSIKFAIQDIIHADNMHSYGFPAVAIFIEFVLALCIANWLKRIGNKTNSQMIKASSFHWFLDTTLSFGICVGFSIALLLRNSPWSTLTPYIDPVMAIILAVIFIASPVKSGLHNIFELLDAAPVSAINAKVRKVISQLSLGQLIAHRLRIRKAGQRIFIDVCFIVEDNLTVARAEELAAEFNRDLKAHLPDSDVVVSFKTNRQK